MLRWLLLHTLSDVIILHHATELGQTGPRPANGGEEHRKAQMEAGPMEELELACACVCVFHVIYRKLLQNLLQSLP